MAPEPTRIAGVVKDGVVHPVGDVELPEGARVEIVLPASRTPPEIATPDLPGLGDWERDE